MMRWLSLYRWTLLHSLRMTAASTAAFAAAYALGLPEGLSAAVTAIVVTESNVGGSFKTAFEQIIGSILGATFAIAVALVIRPDDGVSSAIGLAIALGPLSILAARSPGFRIAPVTAAIVLLGGAGPQFDPFNLAAYRMLGVGLGCGVGLLISVVIVPARASRSVLETADRIAGLMAEQLEALAAGGATCQETITSSARDTRESLVRLASFVEQATHERRARLAGVPDGQRLLRTLRRVRHDVDMIRRAAREAGTDVVHECAAASWERAAQSGASTIRSIRRFLAGEHVPGDFNTLKVSVRDYRTGLDDLRRTGVTNSLSTAELARLFGIGFALDQLGRDLDDLIEAARETSSPESISAGSA